MRIDRNNYEEFFILYVDNELTAHERQLVEEFIQKHPDLEEELMMLKQTKIFPDNSIVFERKEELVKEEKDLFISLSNYEEALLLYTDKELNIEERTAVEEFTSRNPEIKKELDLLLSTCLQPEKQIVFDNKEILYRKEEKGRVVRMPWWRIAAAAVLIIGAGTITFTIMNKEQTTVKNNNVAGIKKPDADKPLIKNNIGNKKAAPAIEENNRNTIAISPVEEKSGSNRKNVLVNSKKSNKEINKPEEEKKFVVKDPNKKESNNLPDPAPGIKADIPNTPVNIVNINEYSVPSRKVNVTERPVDSYIYITDASENKTKRFRGFLRKATRILERRANISATDEDDRLLIGGLAVKL